MGLLRYLRERAAKKAVINSGFWFVDIPRTSSTSVRIELGDAFGAAHGKSDDQTARFSYHKSARNIRHKLGSKHWSQIYKFSIVRNPWDRHVSLFYFLRKRKQLPEDLEFSQFCKIFADSRAGTIVKPFNYKAVLMTCSEFVCDESNHLLVDDIIHFEERTEGLKRVGDRINLPSLGQTNLGSNRPQDSSYRDMYSDVDRKLLAPIFENDCNLFNYSF